MRIINRINVITATYSDAEKYSLQVRQCICRRGKTVHSPIDITDSRIRPQKTPVLLLVGGYGVITKAVTQGSDIMRQVTSDDNKFIWNYDGPGRLMFVRAEQLSQLHDYLEGLGLRVAATECFDTKSSDGETELKERAEGFLRNVATVKNILRPSPEGSMLAQILFHNIKMPVLATVLLLLAVNVVISRNINHKYTAARHEKEALQKKADKLNDSSRSRQQTLAEFNHVLPHGYAFIYDRIGSVVPDNVVLTRLALQPLQKSLEQERRPQLAEQRIVINGEVTRSEHVSAFVSALNSLEFASDVHLTSVDRERDGSRSVFRIDIEL